MRILYHHRTQGRGAEGVHIRGMVDGLKCLGHEVRVFSPCGSTILNEEISRNNKTQETLAKFNRSRLWKVISYQAPQFLFETIEFAYNFYSYLGLKSIFCSFRPDFIYDRYALFSISPLLLAHRYNTKFILEINDATIIQRSRPLVFRKLAHVVEMVVFRNASVLITISENFKQRISSAYNISPSKIVVIPNAIDPARFHEFAYRDPYVDTELQGKLVIGVVGAFVPWHGIDFLIESIQDLLATRKDLAILLVGDGPVRTQINALIDRLGLQGRVKFTGFVPSSHIPKYVSCMDICVMADSNEHGSPMKIFEYMAMGKPVVAPKYGPIEEIMLDGKTGILFRPRDKRALSRAIERLLSDRRLRENLGRRAKEYVFQHHTWTLNAQRIVSILQGPPEQNHPRNRSLRKGELNSDLVT